MDEYLSSKSFDTPAPITSHEWSEARATPDCIVEDYLYADVAVFIAPGGMGKPVPPPREPEVMLLPAPVVIPVAPESFLLIGEENPGNTAFIQAKHLYAMRTDAVKT